MPGRGPVPSAPDPGPASARGKAGATLGPQAGRFAAGRRHGGSGTRKGARTALGAFGLRFSRAPTLSDAPGQAESSHPTGASGG
jgi:hypothetical protein